MRNIYLIGHMASGKTTVGQLLAQTLNLDFVDTDSNIEYLFSKPINEIFTKEGESQFRIFETAVLLQTTLISNTVISTGGGILTRMRNGLYMKDFGFVIYLELDIKHQAQRLLADDQLSKRPIVRDCKNIEDLIKKLEDLHEKRDLT
ncbi:shikimate kinase, partial [Psittacicella gerlachiana]